MSSGRDSFLSRKGRYHPITQPVTNKIKIKRDPRLSLRRGTC